MTNSMALIRNFTNQLIIGIFDPIYDHRIIKKKLIHKIKHQKLTFIIGCALLLKIRSGYEIMK